MVKKNKLKKITRIIVLQLVCFSLYSPTALIAQPAEDIFRISYECVDLKGNHRWKAVTEVFSSPEKGQGISTLVERGKGIFASYKEEISWQAELDYIMKDEQARIIKSHNDIFDASGKLISIESQEFDYNSNIATFRREDKRSGEVYSDTFKFKEDIINRFMLGLYVQQFLKSGKKEVAIQMLSNEPKLIRCKLYIVGKEDIEINGQSSQAYKLCLDPQLGLLSFVKILIPKAYAWHSAKPDFEWLRYKGLESSLSSPIVEITKSGSEI